MYSNFSKGHNSPKGESRISTLQTSTEYGSDTASDCRRSARHKPHNTGCRLSPLRSDIATLMGWMYSLYSVPPSITLRLLLNPLDSWKRLAGLAGALGFDDFLFSPPSWGGPPSGAGGL